MDVRSAELTKYAANCMLATRISLMNELANLAELLGADIEQVRRGIGSDPRIGYDFLYAGIGYGGSCFPKDVKALQTTAKQYGRSLRLLAAVDAVNDDQKRILVQKVVARFGDQLDRHKFALWGLAFKPNTDDMREAPSRVLIEELISRGATVIAYDPAAEQQARRLYGNLAALKYASSPVNALDGADALIVATEWKEFRTPDFQEVRRRLRQPLVFDGRNVYDPALVRGHGLEYHGVGRRPTRAIGTTLDKVRTEITSLEREKPTVQVVSFLERTVAPTQP
jgi:UDPglucose 6-dehydrogenase